MPGFNPTPGFTNASPTGNDSENKEDESGILTDQDQTAPMNDEPYDENMGAKSNSLDTLEDEPGDFLRGEVDVKEQMDRAADALDRTIHGYVSQADEDSPNGELGAAFRNTPGGLEEVEIKTDRDLARAHHPIVDKKKSTH